MHQPLVGVHPLVGDGADLAGVLQDPGDERLGDIRELQRVIGAVEGVVLPPSNRLMWVCIAEPGYSPNGLGMNDARTPVGQRDLLHHIPEGHHVVGHGERVGVAQVDLLLAGRTLVVAELHRDTHLFQRVDGVPAEVGGAASCTA